MNWNLFGLNPKFKDFAEKYPNKTMLGMFWALQWRFGLFILALELVLVLLFVFLGMFFSMISQ